MPLNGNAEPPLALVEATLEFVADGAVEDLKGVSPQAAATTHRPSTTYRIGVTPSESDKVWTLKGAPYPFGVNCRANGSLRRPTIFGGAIETWLRRAPGGLVALSSSSDVTLLLRQWSNGDQQALNRLIPLIYNELRRLAHQRLRREQANQSLNTTGLVHDAYMKLIDVRHARFRDRSHFLAMASRVMRRLLVDQARARRAAKRGGGAGAVELDEALCVSEPQADALAELDDALQRLEALDPRQGQIIEQRYLGDCRSRRWRRRLACRSRR